MNKRKDIPVGKVFGEWTVLSEGSSSTHHTRWLVRCSCGSEKSIRADSILCGDSKSCQDCTKNRFSQLIGQRFGRWTVKSYAGKGNHSHIAACICDCGTVRDVRLTALKTGESTSCGCERVDAQRTHGHTATSVGRSTGEYKSWQSMWQRCTNENHTSFDNYGGRGIQIDPRWQSFEVFLEDMGPKPHRVYSIDRIDNDGNYTPDNCRWASAKEQAQNRRSTRWITCNGKTHSLSEWCTILGVRQTRVRYYLDRGMTEYESLYLGEPASDQRKEELNWMNCNRKKRTDEA